MEREDERGQGSARAAPAGLPEPDIVLLADKVYRLMLAEVRLAQARGQRPPPGGGE